MATHVVIGDPHCTPKASNERFLWAGRLAADVRATHIICMGDFCSMDSLSSYDKKKKSFEGRRYQKDMQHSHEALSLFNKGLGKHKARKIMLHGNHEDRIDRFVDENPELDGTLKISDLNFKQYGWQEVPYKQNKVLNGVYYAHHFPSGILGSAISGENIARTLLTKHKVSATVGHSHLLDYATSTLPNGKKLHALSAGCYLNHKEHFARDTQHMWWSGIIVKREVVNGSYNMETIDYNAIRREYGRL
jgi:hypothetical protein